VEWLGEFFRAIPEVARAFWTFVDGWYGVAVTIGSGILAAAFLGAAKFLRPMAGWLSAIMGGMAATIGMFWIFGVIPSAWTYFADGNRDLLEGRMIPSALPGFDNFYIVFRDTVVVVETTIAVVAVAVIALQVQKRLPRTLAEGEERGPTSGGYR
jgi:nitrate/nitrite transporter NarK